jgi:SSS family solute:Na+ symporter
MTAIHLHFIDYLVLATYVLFVIGVGWTLQRGMQTSSDFLLAGRSISGWVAALAFMSANCGAVEVIGVGACGAKYGMLTCHFYWLGAIAAMAFLGLFMMPFYYGSKARSVPEYLKLRFDEKTRTLNAVAFAAMTVFNSGIAMYILARLLELVLNWDYAFSLWFSAGIVLAYTFLGGLTSAIYNEVLQFFMIVLGFLPLVLLGLADLGGWAGLKERMAAVATSQGLAPDALVRVWQPLHSSAANPMGVEWVGMTFGLGFVLAFGYWCTDFLLVQRAMATRSMAAARRTPLLAAFPKMAFPLLLVVPGMVAMALDTSSNGQLLPRGADGTPNFNMAIPALMIHYFPSGLIGLGLTALIASFMSGMAGNVTAFNTVWTYDLYQGHLRPNQSDRHYLWMGHAATVVATLLSVATAYLASKYNNIMDFCQLIFAFVNAPLFATFLLGMFWKRATGHGAFWGLLAGTLAAAAHHGLTIPMGATTLIKGGWFGVIAHRYAGEMGQNFWTAIFAWSVCLGATILISLLTRQNRTEESLRGLVYSLTPAEQHPELRWHQQPAVLGVVVMGAVVVLNLLFW